MFDHVLVGADERAGSRDAVALARKLVSADGTLTLAHIYRGEPHVWRGSSPPYEAAEHELARELLEKVAHDAGIDAELRSHGATSVGRGLHELAETIGADLIVVGSSQRSLLERVLLGDDTRAALNGATCAVAVAPSGYAQHPALMREVGVGYDGSEESKHALGVARLLAGEHQAKLSALEAVSVPAYALSAGPPFPEDALDSLVEDAGKQVAALGGVEPHAIYGAAAEELALFSASVDLLVIGSRSYGPVGRLVHGSTSQQLAQIARCPLLVLPRAAGVVEAPDAFGEDGHAVPATSG